MHSMRCIERDTYDEMCIIIWIEWNEYNNMTKILESLANPKVGFG